MYNPETFMVTFEDYRDNKIYKLCVSAINDKDAHIEVEKFVGVKVAVMRITQLTYQAE